MKELQELIREFSKDEKVYPEILERLKNDDVIYAALSPATHSCYLNYENQKPTAYIFSKEEYYADFADHMLQQQIGLRCGEVYKDDRKAFFADLARSGFEMLVVDNGQQYLVMSLFDIIQKPTFTNLPKDKRPIMNMELMRCANLFFQELAVARATREQEAMMFKAIYEAKYLLPLQSEKPDDEIDAKGQRIIFPQLVNADGMKFQPFFTDWNEFKKYDAEAKLGGYVAGFDVMKDFMKNADGIVINPFGFKLILNAGMIDTIEKTVKEELAEPAQE